MALYSAEVLWFRNEQDFVGNRYSRRHLLRFDGGVEVAASSSPHVVPLPMSYTAAIDPEEAFVASISSCNMLWFLSIAAKRRIRVIGKNIVGKMAKLAVTLKPEVHFSGKLMPTPEQIKHIHHEVHEECFIANSVKTEVRCEPVYVAL
jgi:organic hydroperoxide reductase OsmC/OhrA